MVALVEVTNSQSLTADSFTAALAKKKLLWWFSTLVPETKECVFHSDISVTSDSVSVKLVVRTDSVVLHASACTTQHCSSNVVYLVIHIVGGNGNNIDHRLCYCTLFTLFTFFDSSCTVLLSLLIYFCVYCHLLLLFLVTAKS